MGLFSEHLCLVMYQLAQLRAAGTVVDTAQQQLQDLLGLCRSRAAGMGPKQLAEVIWALAQVRLWGCVEREDGYHGSAYLPAWSLLM
jgi:hypothetical protein